MARSGSGHGVSSHHSAPRRADPAYVERRREYARQRYRDNPEVRERQRQLRQDPARRDYNRQYQKRWRDANRSKINQQQRARYAARPEHHRAANLRQRTGVTDKQAELDRVDADGYDAFVEAARAFTESEAERAAEAPRGLKWPPAPAVVKAALGI